MFMFMCRSMPCVKITVIVIDELMALITRTPADDVTRSRVDVIHINRRADQHRAACRFDTIGSRGIP